MQCCVPFCRNTTDNVSPNGKAEITFYGFPSQSHLRAAWLKALGKLDTNLPDNAVVCSVHFLDDEVFELSGTRQIYTGAIPSTVQVCLICLNTDSKLYLIKKHKLKEAYENLTGYSLLDLGNLKQTVCIVCAQRLKNFKRFKDQSLRTRSLMIGFLEKNELITKQHIDRINDAKNQLKCSFGRKMLGPNHYDSRVVARDDNEQIMTEKTIHRDDEIVVVKNELELDENTEIMTQNTIHRYDETVVVKNEKGHDETKHITREKSIFSDDQMVIVKTEVNTDSMVADEQLEDLYAEDNFADNFHDDFVAAKEKSSISDHSIVSDAKILDDDLCKALERKSAAATLMGKVQAAGTQVPMPVESSDHQVKYNEYMNLQSDDSDDECGNLQICWPPDSPSYDASNMSDQQDLQKLDGDPLAESPHAVVSPWSARLAANNNYELNKQSSDSIRKINTITNCDSDTRTGRLSETIKSVNAFDSVTANFDDSVVSMAQNKHQTSKAVQKDCTGDINQLNNPSQNSLRTTDNEWMSFDVTQDTYKRRKATEKHKKYDTVSKPYSCSFCDYKCKDKYYLKLHVRIHTGEKPFSCTFCDYKCARSPVLQVHMRRHTGEKPYSCKLCGKKFTDYSNLTSHMRTHSGEKPVSCTLCDFKCVDNGRLLSHMKTHTGEKPFTCTLCHYRCSHKNHLVLHMRTHTGEKPYKCNCCEYKTARGSDLLKHIRTHTGTKP
ncbi:jg23150 [Pararge aegeria aegeria]|uniref:Protein hunchback n=1 Tax=Pararge aegeria aegeria TaxID=348720 RepID=A0A8S4R820_9NEOP|nr:jg23150 [Pararge aegeria aegeria]